MHALTLPIPWWAVEPETMAPAGSPALIKKLLLPLFVQVAMSDSLRADSLGFWRLGEERYWLPRFVFQRTPRVKQRIKIGIFAGIHGDEPAAPMGSWTLCASWTPIRSWVAITSFSSTRSATPPVFWMARAIPGAVAT
ncbi:MAG: hypothetical protein QM796_10500 [Chthoniobacteraceae bacterium]